MSISVLTLGDQPTGRAFMEWVDEFVYALGTDFALEQVSLDKSVSLVLNLVCLPSALQGFRMGTSLKRSDAEFWSKFEVDHASFVSTDDARRIDAIGEGLIGAISQVPTSRMPAELKASFVAAVNATAIRFKSETSRRLEPSST